MKGFNADNWSSFAARTDFRIDLRAHINVHVVSEGTIKLEAHCFEEEVWHLLACSQHTLFFKNNLEGFTKVRISASKGASANVRINNKELQEEHDKLPPPPPPDPANHFQRAQAAMRSQMGLTREEFINDTGFPGYETDDQSYVFEEEEAEAMERRERKRMAEQSAPEGEGKSASQRGTDDHKGTVGKGKAPEPETGRDNGEDE